MKLGEVIRKYRKNKNMTQEEMAGCLGVTAPAVNKWEKGVSYPDLTLIAPIARLLGVSLDTLLSFREELTEEEIKGFICEADTLLKTKPYAECFAWVKKTVEQYPNCDQLILNLAAILDAQLMLKEIPDAKQYEGYLHGLYLRVLESSDETVRSRAADSLYGYHLRKKQYDQAEKYLAYFSKENPERKRKQARIYEETDRIPEAYKAYEELLFAHYQMVTATLQGIYTLAMNEKDMDKAHMIVDKQVALAKCFDMGKYYEACSQLEIATIEKDADKIKKLREEMFAGIDELNSASKSPLYAHMQFKGLSEEFLEDMRQTLTKLFQDEETYGFLDAENKKEK